ncbi:nucleoside deaminase [Bacillus sp. JJ1562]|uniref:nucleoside deaminase n=1 Tax=Bacillus sp. JJ1562 TaxID=3122960 RepID=UPI003002BB9F
MNQAMELAIKEARRTMNKNIGGPFGASIIDEQGNIISVASNTVLGTNDPTAHAEINAIRKAGEKLKTHDLSNYILYATGFPCPMCLSAIIWANIKRVYYGCTSKDAEKIGFRDDFIYKFINNNLEDKEILILEELDRCECLELFGEYIEKEKELY